MKRSRMSVALASFGLTLLCGLGTARALETTSFDLAPVRAACLPDATGQVTVFHKEDSLGVDTLRLDAKGLPGNTDFAVFLTSADAFAVPAFGTVSLYRGLHHERRGRGIAQGRRDHHRGVRQHGFG